MKIPNLLQWATRLLLALPYAATAQAPAFDQAQLCGEPLTTGSFATPNGLAADTQGNTYVAGSFNGSVRFGATTLTTADGDAFVAKRAANGTWLWAVSGGGANGDACRSLTLDAQGGIYVAGFFAGGTRGVPVTATFGTITLTTSGEADVFVAKLSGGNGQWLWAQRAGGGNSFSGADDQADLLAYDGIGGVFVSGTFNGPVSRFGNTALYNTGIATNSNRRDVFIAHLNAMTGAWNWAQSLGDGPTHDAVSVLVSDGWGNAYLSIYPGGTISLGTTTLPYTRGSVLGKVDTAGQWQWAQTLVGSPGANSGSNGAGFTGAAGLALDGRGRLYVTGSFTGATARLGAFSFTNASGSWTDSRPVPPVVYQYSDAYVGRLDANTGAWQWAARSGGAGGEGLGDLVVRGSRLYASGGFGPSSGHFGNITLTTTGGSESFVAALDTAGGYVWFARVNGADNLVLTGLAADADGRLHLTGSFTGNNPARFPPLTLAARPIGFTDFMARLAGGPLAAKTSHAVPTFDLYPNPARDQVTVQGLKPGCPVQVLDALGRRVAEGTVPIRGPLHLHLPAYLSAGLYVVRAQSQSRKLIIE